MSEITQTNLKLLVLALGFVYDKMVRNRLHSDWFGTQSILASMFGRTPGLPHENWCPMLAILDFSGVRPPQQHLINLLIYLFIWGG